MKNLKPRKDLPANVNEALADLNQKLRVPAVICRLREGILTREEMRLIGDAGITTPAPSKDWVSPQKILEVVARQRKLTLERALLDLMRGLGFLSEGRYEQLRKQIGELVSAPRSDVPVWDADNLQLRYKGKLVRQLSPRATNGKRILDAFQDDSWEPRIDNPLEGGTNSRKLRESVRSLNQGLLRIKFFCDGTSEGLFWQELS